MGGRPAPSGPPARLLLADCDPALGRVLHLALEAHGYRVTLADSANALLELAGQEHPDLIVLDRGLGIGQLLDRLQTLRDRSHTATRQGQNHTSEQEAGAQ
jgi:DNA-binding response OmpR family regulator